jgi:hypothetical protein
LDLFNLGKFESLNRPGIETRREKGGIINVPMMG